MNYARKIYKYAPLIEAIFEVRLGQEGFDSTTVGSFYSKIRETYPIKEDVKTVSLIIGSAPDNPPADLPPAQAPKMKAWSSDKKKLLQIGPGLITANELDYCGFEKFKPDVQKAVQSYLETCSPRIVQRIGTRYINRIVIPEEQIKLSDYFNFNFMPPKPLLNANGFQIVFLNSTINEKTGKPFEIRVSFASDTKKDGERGVPFILDIDSYSIFEFSSNLSEIMAVGEIAHSYVGDVFEGFLTDKLRSVLGVEK